MTGSYRSAGEHLQAPFAEPGALNLKPRPGALTGQPRVPPELLLQLPDVHVDFEGRERHGEYLGAYVGGGQEPRWTPALAIKPASLDISSMPGE